MKRKISYLLFFITIFSLMSNVVYSFQKGITLMKLPYEYDSLEPYIDTETVTIHYTKHHQGYVKKLNKAIEKNPSIAKKTLEQLLTTELDIPENAKTFVLNNAGGVYNHNFYWNTMSPNKGGKPIGNLSDAIDKTFGSFDTFKDEFTTIAMKQFGSGWAWLVCDKNGELSIISTSNQDTPLALDLKPIIVIDLWEHAYYLKYQNKRIDYIANWWNLVNWDQAESNFIK